MDMTQWKERISGELEAGMDDRVCGLVGFFFNVTATTEIYTEWIVGSVRCV